MVLPQVSNVCNSNCVHCWFNSNPELRERFSKRFMDKELLVKIIDEMSEHLETKPLLRITGTGEPLLMPELIDCMTYAAGEKNVRTALITNGFLLSPEKSKRLIDAGVEAIEVSADASDEATYESIRRGLKFKTMLNNVMAAVEYRNKVNSSTRILVSVVENTEMINPDEVEAFWRKRVDNVIMRKYLTYGQLSEDKYSKETYLPAEDRVPCPYPFERLVVMATGEVTFCNFDVEDGLYVGDLNKDSIEKVWRNDQYEELRAIVLKKDFENHPLCKKCNDWKYKSWTHNFSKVLKNAKNN